MYKSWNWLRRGVNSCYTIFFTIKDYFTLKRLIIFSDLDTLYTAMKMEYMTLINIKY